MRRRVDALEVGISSTPIIGNEETFPKATVTAAPAALVWVFPVSPALPPVGLVFAFAAIVYPVPAVADAVDPEPSNPTARSLA